MDHSYTRQSKLIKQINVLVWGLLFIAGTILCQRVYSEHWGSAPDVSVADTGQIENATDIDDLLSGDTDELAVDTTEEAITGAIEEKQETQEEVEVQTQVADVQVAPPTKPVVQKPTPKPEVTQTATTRFKPPPRRTPTQTRSRKPPKKPTPPVLATSPINSHTATTQVDSESGLDDEIDASLAELNKPTKTRTTRTTTTKTVPKRRRTKRPTRTTKTAQSSINLTKPTKATPPKDVASVVSETTTPQTVKSTAKQPKPPAKKAIPKANPRQLTIENPKKIGYPVSFLIGADQQTLQPGDKFERLLDKPSSKANVHFDRGGSFGEAIIDMQPGAYEFKVTREGWTIVPQENK